MGIAPARLDERLWFPNPREAIRRGPLDGMVALGGDLSPDRLLLAYRSGIFPWTANPITWWSPDPRGIFELGRIRVSRSLRRVIRKGVYRVTRDAAFREVIEGCALTPRPGSWITSEFIEAYVELHKRGGAHSFETWLGDELVGGIYGVSVGGLFAGESMFHRADNASKVALVALHDHLVERGFALFDVQMVTRATGEMGAIEIPRNEYLKRLAHAVELPCSF